MAKKNITLPDVLVHLRVSVHNCAKVSRFPFRHPIIHDVHSMHFLSGTCCATDVTRARARRDGSEEPSSYCLCALVEDYALLGEARALFCASCSSGESRAPGAGAARARAGGWPRAARRASGASHGGALARGESKLQSLELAWASGRQPRRRERAGAPRRLARGGATLLARGDPSLASSRPEGRPCCTSAFTRQPSSSLPTGERISEICLGGRCELF